MAWAVLTRAVEPNPVDPPSVGTCIEYSASLQAAYADPAIISAIFHLWVGTGIRSSEALDLLAIHLWQRLPLSMTCLIVPAIVKHFP